MEDRVLIIGRLIGIVALTIHDYIRYRLSRIPRIKPKHLRLRRIRRVRQTSTFPYTGETQRLN